MVTSAMLHGVAQSGGAFNVNRGIIGTGQQVTVDATTQASDANFVGHFIAMSSCMVSEYFLYILFVPCEIPINGPPMDR